MHSIHRKIEHDTTMDRLVDLVMGVCWNTLLTDSVNEMRINFTCLQWGDEPKVNEDWKGKGNVK